MPFASEWVSVFIAFGVTAPALSGRYLPVGASGASGVPVTESAAPLIAGRGVLT